MTGRQRSVEALNLHRKDPTEAPLKHQVFRWISRGLAPRCGSCLLRTTCPDFDAEREECLQFLAAYAAQFERLIGLAWIKPYMWAEVEEYCRLTGVLALIDAYVGEVGLVTIQGKRLDLQPILQRRQVFSNSRTRLADRLGLHPTSALARGGPTNPLASAIIKQDEEAQRDKS